MPSPIWLSLAIIVVWVVAEVSFELGKRSVARDLERLKRVRAEVLDLIADTKRMVANERKAADIVRRFHSRGRDRISRAAALEMLGIEDPDDINAAAIRRRMARPASLVDDRVPHG
jgi:hypothetical protein